jgi:hypothetical protein
MAYRGGERTKMKLRLNKNKGMVVIMTATLALIAGVATTPAAFAYGNDPAHCYNSCYKIGYRDGSDAGYNDYWGYNTYSPHCPTDESHSKAWCSGYESGYSYTWGYLAWHGPRFAKQVEEIRAKQQIEQSSNVNIKGSNNRVVITQQANNGAQQPISRYPVYGGGIDGKSSSSSGSQSNPRCLILCANVRIN